MYVVVIAVALALTGGLGWYFFGPRSSSRAAVEGGVQVLTVAVKGGYSPDVIEVEQGVPVRLLFDRQEGADCSSRAKGRVVGMVGDGINDAPAPALADVGSAIRAGMDVTMRSGSPWRPV